MLKAIKDWFFGTKEKERSNFIRKGVCFSSSGGQTYLMVGLDKFGCPGIAFETPEKSFICSLTIESCKEIESALWDVRTKLEKKMEEKKNEPS